MEGLKDSIMMLSRFYGIEPSEIIHFLDQNTSSQKIAMCSKTLRETNYYLLDNCKVENNEDSSI
jgi:hypothetical protein